MPRIRAVLISPFRLYRDALTRLLRDHEDLDVVEAFASVPQQMSYSDAAGQRPDAVFLDARLVRNKPTISEVRLCFPGACILALCVSGREREAVRCTRASVDAVVSHEASVVEIVNALKQLQHGEFAASGPVGAALFSYLAGRSRSTAQARSRLTRREREVAMLAARGRSNKRIAQELGLEIATVKNNMHRILLKTGLKRRSELAARFWDQLPET